MVKSSMTRSPCGHVIHPFGRGMWIWLIKAFPRRLADRSHGPMLMNRALNRLIAGRWQHRVANDLNSNSVHHIYFESSSMEIIRFSECSN